MTNAPSPENVLNVADIPPQELPNGTSSILIARDPHHKRQVTCVIDEAGYLRKVAEGSYIDSHWDAVARSPGDS